MTRFDQAIETRVDRVTVLEDRAQVTRVVTVDLASGEQLLLLGPATPVLVDRTIRCSLRWTDKDSEADAPKLADVAVKRRYVVHGSRPQDETQLREELDEVLERFAELADEAQTLFWERDQALSVLQATQEMLKERLLVAPFDETWRDAIEESRARLEALETTILNNQFSLEDLRLEVARIERELRLSIRPVSDYHAFFLLSVISEHAGACEIELEYHVPCGIWRPSYRATLLSEQATVAWESEAVVWQATGEDWDDASLSFSTARPSLGAQLPILHDDVVSLRDKDERERKITDVSSRDEVIQTTSQVDREESDTPPGLYDGGEARVFEAESRVTVPSDGRPYHVRYDAWESAAESELLCVPEQALFVFLRSIQVNNSSNPLLAGPVRLYRGNSYVGQSSVEYTAAAQNFELAWGSEDHVAVVRETHTDFEETSIRKRRIHTFSNLTRLTNRGRTPLTVTVKERVPVAEIEDVAVKISEESTRTGFERDEHGVLSWQVELPIAASEEVALDFNVSMPSRIRWSG
ncbi:MAG: mucoidy inhibitor MuiA family protein [Myxococcales bacterium]|nr:mucoidy inhibitor MuiA family protein [Myxococcales bacterium]